MGTPHSVFMDAFLRKIKDYEHLSACIEHIEDEAFHYMKVVFAQFNRICEYNLVASNDIAGEISETIKDEDLYEITDIVSEGMVMQWLKPWVNKSEGFENVLSTKDYTLYSPAKLLAEMKGLQKDSEIRYKSMVNEYSFNHGDLGSLHG